MKIVIATGVYPPEIGGPAQYAFNLEQEFQRLGHRVRVLKFSAVRHWPTFVRHVVYFVKTLLALRGADWCLALDTFSVALPAICAGKILGKKVIIRTGGDFLWENYVERTGDLVLLRKFYQTSRPKWNLKEKTVFRLTKFLLRNAYLVVFSTDWQRQIWSKPYNLDLEKTEIIENYYGPKEKSFSPERKNFLIGTRALKWKNLVGLKQAFVLAQTSNRDLIYDDTLVPYNQFIDRLAKSYAVVLVSLGDISPNMILDAIHYDKPFILTKETGLFDRLKNVGVFIDPENINEIKEKILWLAKPENYIVAKKKVEDFSFTHTWPEIADEFLNLCENY